SALRRIRIPDGSETLLALRRRGDAQLFSIFRDGPPGDLNPLRTELLHDPRVRVGPGRVLVRDDLRDLALDREGRDLATLGRVDPAVEEVLHRKESAWGVDVLVRDHARHL